MSSNIKINKQPVHTEAQKSDKMDGAVRKRARKDELDRIKFELLTLARRVEALKHA